MSDKSLEEQNFRRTLNFLKFSLWTQRLQFRQQAERGSRKGQKLFAQGPKKIKRKRIFTKKFPQRF